MDASTLQIIISAKDMATAALGRIDEQLTLLGTTATEASAAADRALGGIDASLDGVATTSTAALGKAQVEMVKTGAAAEEMQLTTSTRLAMMDAATQKTSAEMGGLLKTAALVGAAVVGFIGYESVKAAADFQTQMTKLTSTAGESKDNLKMVGDGILQISRDTGTGAKELADAMYIVESGGQHGANGLLTLKAAAQGARLENSDLKTVADAVTSVLQDYHLKAGDAANVTSKLVAAVGMGKTNFNDFSGALHSILPIASAAHVSLDDVAGTMASMTVHGTTAQQAAQNMADAIRHLQTPTGPMITALTQIGMTSNDLTDSLSSKGLAGTLESLSTTILSKMGPSGKVLLNTLNTSKDAARDADDMVKAMPKNLQSLAQQYQSGSLSLGDYRLALKALPAPQAAMLSQFKSLEDRAHGFSNAIKAGGPDAKTYASMLQGVTGDAASLNVALQTTYENSNYTTNAIKKIGEASADAKGNVKNWDEIQGNFNFKMSQAKETLHTTGITIGTVLLPTLTKVVGYVVSILTPIAEWISHNQKLATVLILVGAGLLAAVVSFIALAKAIDIIKASYKTLGETMETVGKMSFNPWMVAIMAIALIALLVITHWQQVKKFFEDFTSAVPKLFDRFVGDVKYYFNKIVDDISGVLSKWGKQFATDWDAVWNKIHVPVEIAAGVLLTIFGPALALTAASAAKAGAGIAKDFVVNVVKSGVEAIKSGAAMTKNFVVGTAQAALGAAKAGASIAKDFTVNVIKSGAEVVKSSAIMIKNGVTAAAAYAASGWSVAAAWIAANLPIVLIGLAIVALIAIIVLIVKHWQTVKQWGVDAWNGIKVAWSAAVGWFGDIWKGIKKGLEVFAGFIVGFYKLEWDGVVFIFNAAAAFFTDIWNGIKKAISVLAGFIVQFFKDEWNGVVIIWNAVGTFFSDLWKGLKKVVGALGGFISDFFRNEWNGLVNIWNGVAGFFSGLWNNLRGSMGVVGDIIKAPFKDAFNGVARLWNDSIGKLSFNVPGWVPGIGGKGFSMPKLPYLQAGTPYFGGGPVVVGELGPEVVNLPQGSQVYSNANSAAAANGGQPLVGNLNITIQAQAFMGNTSDAQRLATQIYQQLQSIARRHGQASALPNIGIMPV